MKKLQSFHLKEKYVKDIRSEIIKSLFITIYAPVLRTIQAHVSLRNSSTDVIKQALATGKVQYANGKFYGEWTAKLSKAFRDLNGTYDSKDNTWIVDVIPYDLQLAIADAEIMYRNILEGIGGIDFELQPVPLTAYDKTAEVMKKDLWLTLMGVSLIMPRDIETKPYIDELNQAIARYAEEEIDRLLTFINLGEEDLRHVTKSNNTLIQIYNYIDERIEASKRKADFLAKNETNRMVNEYKMEEYQTHGIYQYIWQTMEDDKVRPYHAALNGKIIDYDEPPIQDEYGNRAHAGQWYNCLRGDSVITTAFKHYRLFRRKYRGIMTELVLPLGTLKVTPNHPILTDRGWVKAELLKVGDKIAKCNSIFNPISISEVNPNYTKTTIDEFFSFYFKLFGCEISRTTKFDFHGDISVDNQVDVISVESKLGSYLKSEFTQSSLQDFFTETNESFNDIFLTSDSSFFKAFPIQGFISYDFMSLCNQVFSFFFSSKFHSIEHSLRAISWLDALLDKSIGYNTTTNREFFCELFNTPTLTIKTFQLIVWDLFYSMIYDFVSQTSNSVSDLFRLTAEDFSNLDNTKTTLMEFDTIQDKIISVFEGHIYNLENSNNWYYTDNYITKNCRCRQRPLYKNDKT